METAKIRSHLRRPYKIGTTTVVALAPALVKKLGIDDTTFLEELETEEGILLRIRRLQS